MPRRPDRLPPALQRRLRAALRGGPVHPEVGADPALVRDALDVRLGYLLGQPDTTGADLGASLLTTVARGPDTRRRLERTLAGFLAEHRARASTLAPGRVLGVAAERALAADAVLLSMLAAVADAQDPTRLPVLAPATAGLDDERLHALVDPRVVADVARLTVAAEHSLWRPLASRRTGRGTDGPGRWHIGDSEVAVVVAAGRGALRAVRAATDRTGRSPTWAWVARHEALVRLDDGGDVERSRGALDDVTRPRAR